MSWQRIELSDLCLKIGSGSTPRGGNKSYKESGITLIRSMNVHMGYFKQQNLAFIDEAQAEKLAHVSLEPDDVLLNITGASVARCCAVDNGLLPARVNQHVCILRPNQRKLDNKYLMRYITSADTQKRLLRIAGAGATREAITKNEIQKLKIPLPPLAEQKKIAAILDAADQLRQQDQQLIDHYTTLSQSLFLEMFGDPVTNPMGWEQKTILELTDQVTDGTHHTPNYTQSGIPFLRVTDITESNDSKKFISEEEHLELIKRCHPVPGDILYTKNGTIGVGKIVTWDYDFSIFVSLCLLKPKHELIEVRFLNHFLNTPFALRQAMKHSKEATIKNLHLVEIKKMKVPYPSLETQKEFVLRLDEIESQIEKARRTLSKSNSLFNSLLQRAFKGELTSSKAA